MGRETTTSFTPAELEDIKKYYWIDCEWLHDPVRNEEDAYYKQRVCPTHNIRHRKLPDAETLAMLVLMYPDKTMQTWGNLYNSSREAIRIVYNKATGGSFGQDRMDEMYGTSPDLELLNKTFNEIKEKFLLSPTSVLEYNGVQDKYIRYWGRKFPEILEQYEDAKKQAKTNKLFRPERQCVRCHALLKREDFPKSSINASGVGSACNDCNRASVLAHYKKRKNNFDPENIWAEKKCSTCKQVKSRTFFGIAKGMSGGLQSTCNPCMTKHSLSNPKRRAKFKEAGLDFDKVCLSCDEMRDYWDYYLIKANPYGSNKSEHATEHCRNCVEKAMQALTNEKSLAKFGAKWRSEHKVINDILFSIDPFDYALEYNDKVLIENKQEEE